MILIIKGSRVLSVYNFAQKDKKRQKGTQKLRKNDKRAKSWKCSSFFSQFLLNKISCTSLVWFHCIHFTFLFPFVPFHPLLLCKRLGQKRRSWSVYPFLVRFLKRLYKNEFIAFLSPKILWILAIPLQGIQQAMHWITQVYT